MLTRLYEKSLERVVSTNPLYYHKMNPYYLVAPLNRHCSDCKFYREKEVGGFTKRYFHGKPLLSVTEYEAIYPETFYEVWEILCVFGKNILHNKSKVLCINRDKCSLGYMEAILKYTETYCDYEDMRIIKVNSGQRDKLQNIYNYEMVKSFDKKADLLMLDRLTSDDVCDTIIINGKLGCNVFIHLVRPNKNLRSWLEICFKNVEPINPLCKNPLDNSVYLLCTNMVCKPTKSFPITEELDCLVNIDKYFEMLDRFVSDSDDSEELYIKEDLNKAIEWAEMVDMSVKSCFKQVDTEVEVNIDDEIGYVSHNFPKGSEKITSIKTTDLKFPELKEIKRKLNLVKRIIDTKEQGVQNDIDNDIVDWNKLTNCIDMFKNLKRMVQWSQNCNQVTNSWLKFYEMFVEEPCLTDTDTLSTFHINEMHGSIVRSLSHYLEQNKPDVQWDWTCHTINNRHPGNQSRYNSHDIPRDSFRFFVVNKDRFVNGSGDILNKDVIRNYKNQFANKFNLVTGDGSLRIPSNMFNEQESYVMNFTFSQTLIMLCTLKHGGNGIIKMFLPMVEPFTVSLIYLLTTVFDTVSVVKPSSSHLGSSEIYLICKGYQQCEKEILESLINIVGKLDCSKSLIDTVPDQFISLLHSCSESYSNNQILSIKRSLAFRHNGYYDNIEMQEELSRKREIMVDRWIEKYFPDKN